MWQRLDSALLGWMLYSVSKEVHIKLVTTFQLWTSSAKTFGSQSKAKLIQLKLKLQSTKKGSLSMNGYLAKMKEILDNLAMAG